jgi:uncharacterized DUF497 family protein
MEFDWNPGKRQRILAARGLDFADARLFFDGRPAVTEPSSRSGEERLRTTAVIYNEMVTLVWMWREEKLRVITMRRAHAKEERQFRQLHAR